MKASEFLSQLRHDEIVAAIREAEKRTSGEIRVFISRKRIGNPVQAARRHFLRMKMDRTRHRNGVLIFVAPRTCKFAVIGDAGVHKQCGDTLWREMADSMAMDFRKSEFTRGIVHGIRKAGEVLAWHFPPATNDRNELSDDVAHD